MIHRSAKARMNAARRAAAATCRHWRARAIPGILLIPVVVFGTGCASSRQAAYERHLTAIIAPGPAMSDDVAVAFGLDEYGPAYAARSTSLPTGN